ncbi:MAG: DUF72 domain-containing protein [Telluria sp.]
MTRHEQGTCRIGCAGWAITRDTVASFPAEGSHLERYAQVFGAVEINSSFYRPHRAASYARWAACVPEAFRFAVKLPRTISHDAGLREVQPLLAQFAAEAGALGDKLGCVLVQLPPKFEFNAQVAGDFFARASGTLGCMLACEARHPSWFDTAATRLLTAQAVTRVIADPAKGQPGAHEPTTASIYARLHGSPRIYYSSYADEYLQRLAEDMAVHSAAGRDVWCIFDNTASGASVPNALTLDAALRNRRAAYPGRPA